MVPQKLLVCFVAAYEAFQLAIPKIGSTGIALLILLLGFMVTHNAKAEMDHYIKKYSGVEVDNIHIERVRQYNHYISYFSGFSYFKAHYIVSADFIRALIVAESSGNPRAHSNKNALGLGQIIYTSGRKAAKELAGTGVNFRYIDEKRLKNLQLEDLYDPAINILLTCYLISKYNYKYNGRLDLVLTAWNAGENIASLKQGKPAPYRETEELIGKVNGYYLYFLKNRQTKY